ncbi:MAG: OmpA family protein [Nitrospirales bacterium]|nr:OmpA family protein [Nitrospirales bacterium]
MHRTNELTPPKNPKPILTSLQQNPRSDRNSLSDRMIVPKGTQTEKSNNLKIADPFPTVYFSFDSWEVSSDVQDRLDATAGWMSRFPQYGLTIEGHTDVRGTESYNMVLGAKRAQAVKEYLKNLGILPTRVNVVSYGKVLMLCEMDDESTCHQYNRRAELLLE